MARRRDRPTVNPLLKDRVAAIARAPAAAPAESQPRNASAPDRPARAAHRGKASVQIKARFSASEAEQVDRFARTLSSYLRTTVKGSEVTRALWSLAIRSQDELAELVSRAPRMDRPSYGDRLGMAQYEDAIADFLLLAIKQTRRGS